MKRWALVLGFLAGCGGMKADVTGAIGDSDFSDVQTIYSGGPYILLFNQEIDCIDTAWVAKSYIDGTPPSDVEFTALQFETDDPAFIAGTFGVEGATAITSWGMENTGGEFHLHRARAGTLTIDGVDDHGQWIQGHFTGVEFTNGSVTGSFKSEFCRNMQP